MNDFRRVPGLVVMLLVVGLVIGCGPQESAPPAPPVATPPPTGGEPRVELPPGHPPLDMAAQQLPSEALASAENPTWTVPAGWEPGRASSVRRGSFQVSGPDGQSADIAVTVFPGEVGGMLMNINRWRGQIGLGPIEAEQVDDLTKLLKVGDQEATIVDFAGDQTPAGKAHPQRMIVVTLPHGANSWFFKMTGDAPLVEANKAALVAFVESVTF